MTVLNRASDGLVTVLLALRRTLVAYGPLAEERLLRLTSPASILGREKDMARKTLTRWCQLGLFEVVSDRVRLSPDLASVAPDDIDGVRRCVLRTLMAPSNSPELTPNASDGDDETSLASDFTRAAAWVLGQDPYSMPTAWPGVESLFSDQGVKPRPITNDTRWPGFVEWSAFVGLTLDMNKTFVPIPTFAVRAVLDEAFSGSAELTLATLVNRLSGLLPVLDGGAYRTVVESGVRRPWRTQLANEISPSLSLALLQLEASDEIRLEPRSDAPQHLRLIGPGGREQRTISHAVRRPSST